MFRIEIKINKPVLQLVLAELQLVDKAPTITPNFQDVAALKKKKGYCSEEWGHYVVAQNHVVLQVLPPSYARLPLFQLVPHIRETLLHELRHAYQYRHWDESRKERMWDGPYWLRDMEKDARAWSYDAGQKPEYREVVKVTRIPQGKAVKLP